MVAVDIPSGSLRMRECGRGYESAGIVAADYTITFTAPKIGMLLGKAQRMSARLVCEIGSPSELIEEIGKGDVRWSEPREFARFRISAQARRAQRRLRPRVDRGGFGGEERRGGAGVVGGAARGRGTGDGGDARAGVADCRGAHAGSDDRAAARHGGRQHFAAQRWNTSDFDAILKGQESAGDRARALDAHARRRNLCAQWWAKADVPIVLDADGLNAFAGRAAELKDARRHAGDHAASRRNVAADWI